MTCAGTPHSEVSMDIISRLRHLAEEKAKQEAAAKEAADKDDAAKADADKPAAPSGD